MELNLIPTDDLLDELFARYEHSVWCGLKTKVKGNDKLYEKLYDGDYAICIGLCDIIKNSVLEDLNTEDKELPIL